jgi:S1-C subfamily serine protease
MSRTRALCLAVLFFAVSNSVHAEEKARLSDVREETLIEVIKQAEPSIACILVTRSEDPKNQKLHDPTLVPEAYGSGVVIDDKGLILTNYHVVREATRLFVRLPGDKASYADIYAADGRSDLAVLRLTDAKVLPVPALKMGDGGALKKGQFVLSIANPHAAGFRDGSPSASWGIISNLRRKAPAAGKLEERDKTLHHYGTLIQTDVRLNLGCSGGALVNLKGELIGLTSALAAVAGTETPGGFGVPLDAGMRRIIDVLKRGEEVEYGFLGVSFEKLPAAGGRGDGVRVDHVIERSPAWNATLRGGEFIVAVNDLPVNDPDDLFLHVGAMLCGSEVRLKIAAFPGGPARVLDPVKLAKFYVPGKVIATNRPPPVGGLRVDHASILVQRANPFDRFFNRGVPAGVVIREVVEGSPADTARLQPDKVIVRVNNKSVNSPEEFYREMKNAAAPVELTLLNSDGRGEDKVKLETK